MHKITFIGCGKMGSALLIGSLRSKTFKADEIIACDQYQATLDSLHADHHVATTASSDEAAARSQTLVLCVKPGDVATLLKSIPSDALENKLIISIAAGISLETLAGLTPKSTRLVRVMPNTPCLIGKGASAYACAANVTDQDRSQVETLLSAVGTADQVAESLLDAVTGLSGSGPAYVFTFIEALTDGGVQEGLPRPLAAKLAVQTVIGAANLVKETGKHPAVLRDQVTSPGGTTIAGLAAMEQAGFRTAIQNGVHAASQRSRELGKA